MTLTSTTGSAPADRSSCALALPQLERLAKVKFRAGRIEENGELPVRSVGHASLRGNPWPSMKPLHLPICYDKFEVADGLSHGDRIGRRVHAC
jgi:hypothetical protein